VSEVVALLGPRGAGKSSVGRRLSRALGWPQRSVDATCWAHYRELPEVAAAERALALRHGPEALADPDRLRYLTRLSQVVGEDGGAAAWRSLSDRMRVHAAVRALTGPGPAVVDFGAGHARLADPERRAALDAALAACRLAVWLQPWPSAAESVATLTGRLQAAGRRVEADTLATTCDPAERPRAATVMFTGDRTPDEIAAELLARLGAG
jgi:hypothetical protein